MSFAASYCEFIVTGSSCLLETRENIHKTRHFQALSNESRRTVNCGLETIFYRAKQENSKLWPRN